MGRDGHVLDTLLPAGCLKVSSAASYGVSACGPLRYAAGSPSDRAILGSAQHTVSVHELRHVFDGPCLPDWQVVAQLTTALWSLPEITRPLRGQARSTTGPGCDLHRPAYLAYASACHRPAAGGRLPRSAASDRTARAAGPVDRLGFRRAVSGLRGSAADLPRSSGA